MWIGIYKWVYMHVWMSVSMSIWVCECGCVWVRVCKCESEYVYEWAHEWLCVWMCMWVCMSLCECVSVCACVTRIYGVQTQSPAGCHSGEKASHASLAGLCGDWRLASLFPLGQIYYWTLSFLSFLSSPSFPFSLHFTPLSYIYIHIHIHVYIKYDLFIYNNFNFKVILVLNI